MKGFFLGVSVGAAREKREGNALALLFQSQVKAVCISRAQKLFLTALAVFIYGARGVDNVFCRKSEGRSCDRLACFYGRELFAGDLQLALACGIKDSATDASADLSIGVGGVYDCMNFHFRNVVADY